MQTKNAWVDTMYSFLPTLWKIAGSASSEKDELAIMKLRPLLLFVLLWLFNASELHAQLTLREMLGSDTFPVKKNGHYHVKSNYERTEGRVHNYKLTGKWVTSHYVTDEHNKEHWRVTRVVHFSDGQLNGFYLELDDDGDTMVAGHYSHNRKVGVWKSYYSDFVYADTKLHNLYHMESYDAGGHPEGKWFTLFPDGKLAALTVYTDTSLCYQWTYYSNGNLQSRGHLFNGTKDGVWYTYPRNDSMFTTSDTLPVVICEWKNGARNGSERTYIRGELQTEINYSEGFLDGFSHIYHDGVLTEENHYEKGHLDGWQKTFTPTGGARNTCLYSRFRVIERHQCDSATGRIIQSYWYGSTDVDSVKEWSVDGRLLFEKRIDPATRIYHARSWYENGQLADSGSFDSNGEIGAHFHWYENGQLQSVDHSVHNGYNETADVWNEKGVHVIHALPSRSHDTIPEQVWSDKGQKLIYGTAAYNAQRARYLPLQIAPYDEGTFFLHTVVVKMLRNEQRSKSNDYEPPFAGQAVLLEIGDSVATYRRVAPQFPGGESMFYKYLHSNIHYPEMEKDAGVSGNTWLSFNVQADGRIDSVVILKRCSPGCDKEACRVIKQMPQWQPAMKKGKAIETRCIIEVKWELE